MKLNQIVAYLLGGVAFMFSFLIYMQYVYQLGFPDGFITELGYAQRRLAYLFIGISIIVGAYFIYLSTLASQKKIGKPLLAAAILYVVVIVSLSLMDYYYRLNLIGSGGG